MSDLYSENLGTLEGRVMSPQGAESCTMFELTVSVGGQLAMQGGGAGGGWGALPGVRGSGYLRTDLWDPTWEWEFMDSLLPGIP